MKVSVIVPVYNSEFYLRDCLDSLVNQTLQEIEIIAIDDNSTDCSFEILKEYEAKYPNKMKIFQNKCNLGQSTTRNKGIKEARGEYIGFVDSDDYVNFHMYQTMYEEAVVNDYPEVITTNLIFVQNDYYLGNNFLNFKINKGKIFDVMDNTNCILMQSPSVCNKLFRADTVQEHLFLEGRMWEDIAFSFAKMFCAQHILSFNNVDYFYRRRRNEGISSKGYDVNFQLLDIFDVVDQIELEIKEKDRFMQLREQVRFIQIVSCLQRVVEIFDWNILENEKIELCYLMISLIKNKYGDFRKISMDDLSARIGFLELEKINNIFEQNKELEVDCSKEKIRKKLLKLKNDLIK